MVVDSLPGKQKRVKVCKASSQRPFAFWPTYLFPPWNLKQKLALLSPESFLGPQKKGPNSSSPTNPLGPLSAWVSPWHRDGISIGTTWASQRKKARVPVTGAWVIPLCSRGITVDDLLPRGVQVESKSSKKSTPQRGGMKMMKTIPAQKVKNGCFFLQEPTFIQIESCLFFFSTNCVCWGKDEEKATLQWSNLDFSIFWLFWSWWF